MAKNEKEEKEQQRPILSGEMPKNNIVYDHYFGTAERTEMVSSYVEDTYYAPYNPDDLYQKCGDHSIYTDMQRDDQVHACLQLKKDLVIGGGWDIVTEDEGDQEIADALYASLEEHPEKALDDYLDTYLQNAYSYGFALAEKVFQKKEDGMLCLKSLKTRHPDSWLIHTDVSGNVERYEQRQSKMSVNVNPKSIMHYTPTESTVGPYGESDLRKIYSAWFTKRHITRFYSIYLEGAAKPIPVARYDKNIPDSKVTALHNIIKNFQVKTAMTIPKEIEIEFLEAKSNGEAFTKGINLFNMFIGRGLFIPDLLGFTGEGSNKGGSQALGREQVEMFLKHIEKRRRTLERLINRHIVQPIIVHNFGFMEKYPKFQFRPITQDDTREYARIFIEAVKGKFYNPTEEEVNHLRSLIKFPEGDVDLIPSGSAGGGTPLLDPQGNPLPGQEPELDDDGNPVEEKEPDPEKDKKKDEFAKLNARSAFPKADLKQRDYDSQTDYVAIESQLNASEKEIMVQAKPIINDIFDDLYAQLEKKRILEGKPKIEKLDNLKLKNLGKLQNIMKRSFREAYTKHGQIVLSEVIKSDFRNPMPADEFLEYLDKETFQAVGDWQYEITKGARTAMNQAIKNGYPLSAAIDFMEEEVKGKAMVALERYARTKHTEVMNHARVAVFKDTQVVDRFIYKAILDARTSPICEGLHDKIFEKGKAPIPPLHFNCRSVLVPITVFQEGEPSRSVRKKPIEQFIEENKGKGFSKK